MQEEQKPTSRLHHFRRTAIFHLRSSIPSRHQWWARGPSLIAQDACAEPNHIINAVRVSTRSSFNTQNPVGFEKGLAARVLRVSKYAPHQESPEEELKVLAGNHAARGAPHYATGERVAIPPLALRRSAHSLLVPSATLGQDDVRRSCNYRKCGGWV